MIADSVYDMIMTMIMKKAFCIASQFRDLISEFQNFRISERTSLSITLCALIFPGWKQQAILHLRRGSRMASPMETLNSKYFTPTSRGLKNNSFLIFGLHWHLLHRQICNCGKDPCSRRNIRPHHTSNGQNLLCIGVCIPSMLEYFPEHACEHPSIQPQSTLLQPTISCQLVAPQ